MTEDRDLASLLNQLVVEDEGLDPPEDLEHRTLAAWDVWQQASVAKGGDADWWRRLGPAAAVAAALIIATAAGWGDGRTAPSEGVDALTSAEPRRFSGAGPSADPIPATGPADTAASIEPHPVPFGAPPADTPAPSDRPETWAFIRLTPGPEGDLSGSFQIARVRVPGRVLVDLGVLRLPDGGRTGDATIDADVMFGEDGLARAIRVVPTSRRVP